MAKSLRSPLGSSLAAAPTPRSILAPSMKARACHHPSRQRQPSLKCDPVSNHAVDAVEDVPTEDEPCRSTPLVGDGAAAVLDDVLLGFALKLGEGFAAIVQQRGDAGGDLPTRCLEPHRIAPLRDAVGDDLHAGWIGEAI